MLGGDVTPNISNEAMTSFQRFEIEGVPFWGSD